MVFGLKDVLDAGLALSIILVGFVPLPGVPKAFSTAHAVAHLAANAKFLRK